MYITETNTLETNPANTSKKVKGMHSCTFVTLLVGSSRVQYASDRPNDPTRRKRTQGLWWQKRWSCNRNALQLVRHDLCARRHVLGRDGRLDCCLCLDTAWAVT